MMHPLTRLVATIAFGLASLAALKAETLEVKPRLYLSPADVARLRAQAGKPELAPAYAQLAEGTGKSVDSWRKKYPVGAAPRSTGELIEIGKRDNPGRDYKTIATAFALHPTPELGVVLREKLVASIGARQINNYWRNDGIHEGEAAMQFLEAYDLAEGAGILSGEDRQVIKEEMRQCAHFLEGWTLDNQFSQGYREYYREVYCLNFHVFASSVMGTIAMLYPDLPESPKWLRAAHEQLPKLLFTEFGLDGGYGEGSLHYWHPTFRALLQFMIANRNLGVRDYFADPSVAEAMRRTLLWRMNLTEPDGRSFAVGDSDRDTVGAEYLIQGGAILNDPACVWVGRAVVERARTDRIPAEPYDLFYYDFDAPAHPPETVFANLRHSGYTVFRSGWGPRDNYFLVKYGTTYIGQRESERYLVISGHSHADALELELHYKGLPITVDPGRVGRYQDWNTYGGYCKATVAHNTVGLGNRWGYDRMDGLYGQHVKEHGKEFLYETSQNDIGRADSTLVAAGDTGQMGIFSAKLKTYDDVTQQRTVVWFRDTGVAVVNDQMESGSEQPYEWYLNPVGKLLNPGKVLTFGDDTARLDVVPILPLQARIQIVGKGDPKMPPYYVGLRPDEERPGAKPAKPYVVKDRWGQFTLLVQQKTARQTDFLNVLVPYEKVSPLATVAMGDQGAKLTGSDSVLLVAGGGNSDPTLTVNGVFGVARLHGGQLSSYALHHGHGLKLENQELIKVELVSKPWEPFFDSAVTAAVSLVDRRACFSFPCSPMDTHLVMFSPKLEEGKEPVLPMVVSVSFKVNEKPKRIVALRSSTETPKLDDPEFERATKRWKNDPHQGHYLREQLDFNYSAESQTVTVKLDLGIRQLVWE